jgi:heme oxygenase (biliverdin-IX-beta and delta-forming)
MWQGPYNRTGYGAMISSENTPPGEAAKPAAQAVTALIESARMGVLASLLPPDGAPYASLVNVASDGGEPILLLSRLAWHTQNILADNRACLLITEEAEGKDPLEGQRVSLIGRLSSIERMQAEARYFPKHPNARSYARFADFNFYKLNVEKAHYVAGFGQIVTMERSQLYEASR